MNEQKQNRLSLLKGYLKDYWKDYVNLCTTEDHMSCTNQECKQDEFVNAHELETVSVED